MDRKQCCEMLPSGHDMAVTQKYSQQPYYLHKACVRSNKLKIQGQSLRDSQVPHYQLMGVMSVVDYSLFIGLLHTRKQNDRENDVEREVWLEFLVGGWKWKWICRYDQDTNEYMNEIFRVSKDIVFKRNIFYNSIHILHILILCKIELRRKVLVFFQ